MANLKPKIRKLILALSMRGEKYTLEQYQFWSEKAGRICTAKKLSKLIYSPEKGRYIKEEVLSAYSDVDILLKLVGIYKEGVASG